MIDQVAVGANLRCAVDKNIVIICGLAVQLLPGAVNDSITPNPDLTVIRCQAAAFLYQQAGITAELFVILTCDIPLMNGMVASQA